MSWRSGKRNKYSARRGGKVKERACSSRGEKIELCKKEEERLSKLEEEILLWEKELADYQKLMEQSISEINKQVSELTTFLNSAEERLRKLKPIALTGLREPGCLGKLENFFIPAL